MYLYFVFIILHVTDVPPPNLIQSEFYNVWFLYKFMASKRSPILWILFCIWILCCNIHILNLYVLFQTTSISYPYSQTMHLTYKFVILWTYELESCEFILLVYSNRFTFCRILSNFNMVLCPFDVRHLFWETWKCVISNLYSLPVNVDLKSLKRSPLLWS